MSETLTDLAPDAAPDPTPDAQPAPDGGDGGAKDPPETEPAADPDPAPSGRPRTDRHIAHLTAAKYAETQRADAAERRAQAAEALLAAGRTEDGEAQPTPRPGPATDVETRAKQLVEEQKFNSRLAAIDAAGKKEHGADAWESTKATMTGLGATGNTNFLQALAEAEHPARIFAALADDPDLLVDLLNKSPAALAARLARMDAELSKPVVKPTSAAPRPAARVEGSGVLPTMDIYNYPADLSMAEFNKMADAILPPHLGGKRKVA